MYDAAIIGGGPAGTAAAICCAQAGWSVVICERQISPASVLRPVESLHPGCVTLLDRLGMGDVFRSNDWPRFPGIEAEGHYSQFGADADGPWLGYHIDRGRFDHDLQDFARSLGVEIRTNVAVRDLLRNDKKVAGIVTANGAEISARWVIDASGRRQWAAGKLGLKHKTASSPLMAWRGDVAGRMPDLRARLTRHGPGWLWTVQTDIQTITWTLLTPAEALTEPVPPVLAGSPVQIPARGFDLTWRAVRPTATPGLLLVGDAATVLDPATGQGVFFALESGIRAAQTLLDCEHLPAQTAMTLALYDDWVMREFERKTLALRSMYKKLGIGQVL